MRQLVTEREREGGWRGKQLTLTRKIIVIYSTTGRRRNMLNIARYVLARDITAGVEVVVVNSSAAACTSRLHTATIVVDTTNTIPQKYRNPTGRGMQCVCVRVQKSWANLCRRHHHHHSEWGRVIALPF